MEVAMNVKKLENQVKINSLILDEKLASYIKKHKDEYIVFNDGEAEFTSTFKEGVNKGLEKYGENVGFVVKKVTKRTPIFSSLVTL